MIFNIPRLMISALRGGSGKTVLTLGLTAAWRKKGHRVAPFKKGPDFIDAGWLRFAAERTCHNLDPFMMDGSQMKHSFFSHSQDSDISLIEGNRGLFDGLDLDGCCSTAELGRLLKCPVVIIVDVTMTTRTVAALVMGCQKFDPELNTAGVLLNRVGGARQESLVRKSIEQYCDLPVLGAVPKLRQDLFPERHMGLIPYQEREQARKAVNWARENVEKNLDLDALWQLARAAPPLEGVSTDEDMAILRSGVSRPVRIGFVRDRAFWFYYPENLEHLRRLGAELVEMSAVKDRALQDVDALYIGGGFPETQASALADNEAFRKALKEKIEEGLPVYAECGGLMYLGRELLLNGRAYPMVGALPVKFLLEKRPQGHGYTLLEVTGENPYFPVGQRLKGHEFHYSRPLFERDVGEMRTVFRVCRGHGIDGRKDGLSRKNLLATYTHLHSAGCPSWGKSLFHNAALIAENKKRKISRDSKRGIDNG